jgi:hypothetical protein
MLTEALHAAFHKSNKHAMMYISKQKWDLIWQEFRVAVESSLPFYCKRPPPRASLLVPYLVKYIYNPNIK